MGKTAFPVVLELHRSKHEKAERMVGWHTGFVYQLINNLQKGTLCSTCNHYHQFPEDDLPVSKSNRANYNVIKRAKEITKVHNTEVIIVRKMAKFYHKAGKKSYYLSTYVPPESKTQLEMDWKPYLKVLVIGGRIVCKKL